MDLLEEKLQEIGLVDIIDEYTNNNLYDKTIDEYKYTIRKLESRIKYVTDIDINDIDNLHPYAKFLYMHVIYMYYFKGFYLDEGDDIYDNTMDTLIEMEFTDDKGNKSTLELNFSLYDEPSYSIEIEWFENKNKDEVMDDFDIKNDGECFNIIYQFDDFYSIYRLNDKDESIIKYIAAIHHLLHNYNFISCDITYRYSLSAWSSNLVGMYNNDNELNFSDDPSYLLNDQDYDSDDGSYNYFLDSEQKGVEEVVRKYYGRKIEGFLTHIAEYCDKSIKIDFKYKTTYLNIARDDEYYY